MNQGVPAVERFRMKYAVAENGCWVWMGADTGPGHRLRYGRFRAGTGTVLAHRWSYEQTVGPVPEGLDLDHLCRNTLCVNPAHLEPVSRRENVVRGTSPNAKNAAKTHCKRGHPLTPENVYSTKRTRQCKLCARAASKEKTERRRMEKRAAA